jgi:dolichyl-phosphate beta-glucosyltransferase
MAHSPDPKRVCLVVPCYNEADRLDVESFRAYLFGQTDTQIIFVDDGSQDGTRDVLQKLCSGLEDRAEILSAEVNHGKAEAVRRGIRYVLENYACNVIGFWDADLATPLDTIERFLCVLDQSPEVEMVFGARVKLLGRHVERRAIRHYLGRIFATVVSTMLQLPIYDTQCGAKLFRRTPHMAEVFRDEFLSKWVFDVEIIARYLNSYQRDTARLEHAIYEYPLETWVDVAGSKVRLLDFVAAVLDIVRIKRRYLS